MRGRGPALIITRSNYPGINFPNFAPSGDKFQTNAAAARGEHGPRAQHNPRVCARSEHRRTRAAAAESGPWRQPFPAEYAQYLSLTRLTLFKSSLYSLLLKCSFKIVDFFTI